MGRRDYMIAAREALGLTRKEAAQKLKISETLYTWLEMYDTIITHPHFADRIRQLYKLTREQRNSMVNPIHYIGRK